MLSLKAIQESVIASDHLRVTSDATSSDRKENLEYLDMSHYSGVVKYHPEELVITVKAGTAIKQLNEVLARESQITTFSVDKPITSIGSAYAMGCADLRDSVLGVKIIDGQGRLLTFGGQVMKNVAGYDVARLLVGSKGQLAVICEISFKVVPIRYKDLTNKNGGSEILPRATSEVLVNINQGLKNIFDPHGVFI